jgi:hypothetical protein
MVEVHSFGTPLMHKICRLKIYVGTIIIIVQLIVLKVIIIDFEVYEFRPFNNWS